MLAALAFVAIGTLCASQVEAQSKSIGLGLRGGLNLSTVSASPAPSPPEEISSKTGFHAGVVVALDLHEYFGIEIDGLYTQQGFTDTETEPGVRPATVFLDVLYDLGLTNLVENPAPDESVKSRNWMFSAGFTYPVAILQ